MRFKALAAIVSLAFCLNTAAAQQATSRDRGAFGDGEYRLGPEDVIQVFVWKDPDLSPTVVIRPDGKISLPLIGEMAASGKTQVQLEGEVAKKLQQFISDPVVNVIVKEIHSAKVSVLGEVKKPGVYPIKEKATILDAIASAEGFTEYAKKGKVTIIRTAANGDQRHIDVNVEQLINDRRGDAFYVQPYDKIYVR